MADPDAVLQYMNIGTNALGFALACKRLRTKKTSVGTEYTEERITRDKAKLAGLGQELEHCVGYLKGKNEWEEYSEIINSIEARKLAFEMVRRHYPSNPVTDSLGQLSGLLKKFASNPAEITEPQLKELEKFFLEWRALARSEAAIASSG